MATTLTIPLTTLPVGTRNLGPSHPADAESQILLTIDRTVTGGLNSLTSASRLSAGVDQSNDGGVTWQSVAGFNDAGGTILGKTGQPVTQNTMQTWLIPGASRQLRATVTVTGPSAIAVAGSLVTS